MQEKSVLSIIWDFIFGQKYYANIIHTRGVEKYELSSFIFRNPAAAELHRRDIESTATYAFVETISFRSRKHYPPAQRINR